MAGCDNSTQEAAEEQQGPPALTFASSFPRAVIKEGGLAWLCRFVDLDAWSCASEALNPGENTFYVPYKLF